MKLLKKLLSIIKNIVPLSVLFKLKYTSKLFNQKELEYKHGKCIYYLDAPDYANLGDQAIALAIRKFSEREFQEYEFIEVLQSECASYLKWIKKNIKPDDIIFLTGGGNIGNKYRMYEATRRFVINSLPYNRVFIFPQSIDFSDNVFGRASLNKAAAIYNRPNVTLFIRESVSLKKIEHFIPKVILVPDIVLSLKLSSFNDSEKKHNVGLCLRNDIEGLLTEEGKCKIRKVARRISNSDIQEISTMSDLDIINSFNRESVVLDKIKEFMKCKIVITDRLHAMIFCVISNTPCVVFDNKNHKIKGVFEWINGRAPVVMALTTEDVDIAISEVLQIKARWDGEKEYKQMSDIILK